MGALGRACIHCQIRADDGILLVADGRWTLDETLQDLVILYTSVSHRTLLPHPALELELEGLSQSLQRRERELILMPTRKRKMLLKLLALRMFLGDHVSS